MAPVLGARARCPPCECVKASRSRARSVSAVRRLLSAPPRPDQNENNQNQRNQKKQHHALRAGAPRKARRRGRQRQPLLREQRGAVRCVFFPLLVCFLSVSRLAAFSRPSLSAHRSPPPPEKKKKTDRKRWVVYAERTPPYKPNPTSIPPEWHGWINYINDYEPGNHKVCRRVFFLYFVFVSFWACLSVRSFCFWRGGGGVQRTTNGLLCSTSHPPVPASRLPPLSLSPPLLDAKTTRRTNPPKKKRLCPRPREKKRKKKTVHQPDLRAAVVPAVLDGLGRGRVLPAQGRVGQPAAAQVEEVQRVGP
jgi:hypothetical protein